MEYLHDELKDMISKWIGPDRVPAQISIAADTSDFFKVNYDDIVFLNERPYLVRNSVREGRFSIDDEPKFWVKRAVDLIDGSLKIIKFVFMERFTARVGDLYFECVRSPRKEARILDIVRGNPRFMQGFSVRDSDENIIRVLDFIPGKTMEDTVSELGKTHKEYFYSHFPVLLDEFVELVKAIGYLHSLGEKHGDIRRDHTIKDNQTGIYRWIDFDYNYEHRENVFGYDLFGLGNILAFLVGCGDVTVQALRQKDAEAFSRLSLDDLNIIFNNRVINLKKIYPYVPDSLNTVLLHFSMGAHLYYDKIEHFLEDLQEARTELLTS